MISQPLNLIVRKIPETDETGWGEEATGILVDLIKMADGTVALISGQAIHIYGSTSTTLDPGATLTRTHAVHKVQGNNDPVTLSTTVAIADGTRDGELLILEGSHTVFTVTLQDGANVQLRGDCVLGPHDALALRWDAQVGDWREEGRKATHRLQNQLGLELYEARVNGTQKITLRAPANIPTDMTLTLPSSNVLGHLRNDGSGGLTWDAGLTSAFENVKSYGAVGNGVADDTTAIQIAINTVVTAGGGVVFFPRGSYKVTSSLVIPITARNLTCYGPGATIEGYVNAGILIISDLTTASNRAEKILLDGITLNGRGATDGTYTAQNGLELYACLNVELRNVAITNIPQYGFVGLKSTASGSDIWDSVVLNHVKVSSCGKEGLRICKTGVAGDDLIIIDGLFKDLGKRLTTEPTTADGGVSITVTSLTILGMEVSGVRNDNTVNGFTRAAVIRKAGGLMSGLHFSDNCNNQVGSYDLLLDTDCNGLAVVGVIHSCNTVNSANNGIACTSKQNTIQNVRMDGGGAHVFTVLVDVTGAVNPVVSSLGDAGTPPSSKYLNFTAGTDALSGAVQGDFLAHQVLLPNAKYLRGRTAPGTVRILIGLDGSDKLRIGDVGLTTDTIFDSTGRVGIGTASPAAKFDIQQVAAVTALHVGKGAGVGNALAVENSGSGVGFALIQDGAAVAVMINQNAASDALQIFADSIANGITVTQAGTGYGIFIQSSSVGNASALGCKTGGTGACALFQQDGNGTGIDLRKNGSGGGTVLVVVNAGSGDAVSITHSGNGRAVLIDKQGSGGGVPLKLQNSGTDKFIDTNPISPDTVGAFLSNGGDWTNASCWRELKTQFEDIDPEDFLQKLAQMKIQRYRKISQLENPLGNGAKEFGPFQDDLVGLFGLNDHGVRPHEIASIALVVIQALITRLDNLKLPGWGKVKP